MNASGAIWPKIATHAVTAPTALAEVALAHSVADYRKLLARMRSIQAEAQRDVAEVRALTDTFSSLYADVPEAELDADIEKLWAHEQRLQAAHAEKRAICNRLLARPRGSSSISREIIRQIIDLYLTMSLEDMRAIRDARWELMAIDAERVPPADGPTLSSVEELDNYLRSLAQSD